MQTLFLVLMFNNSFQKEKLDEVMEEIRILKSIVLKQEVRIRELEKRIEEQKVIQPVSDTTTEEENSKQNVVNNNHVEPIAITVDKV